MSGTVSGSPPDRGRMGDVLFIPGSIEDAFRYVSELCTFDGQCSPLKSHPMFRRTPPSIRNGARPSDMLPVAKGRLVFHLPPDYRFLYPASPLAYYLGASVEIDSEPHIALRSGERMEIPWIPELEGWAGEALRKAFYLDCAVRYAAVSGGALNGLDVRMLLGRPAQEVFDMGPGERFFLYSAAPDIPGIPVWHMAAYLDPVPASMEALPALLYYLSAIYMPRSTRIDERGIVSMSIRDFLGRSPIPASACADARRSIVLPSLYEAGSQLWFSDGFPVDAAKASVRAFARLHGHKPKRKGARIGIICNEESMEGEADAIVDAMADTSASLQIYYGAGVEQFSDVFARGFDVLQLIGHCDERGFKCADGFAKVGDIGENNTPMFFFNSCASYREAARLAERGSVCGVATLFRVLEEAALDVCKDFYHLLGAGYTASVSLAAARECSALGKEYLLIGDGSFRLFDGDPLKPFYRIVRRDGGYALRCTMGNVDKGYVVRAWSPEGVKAISDLGHETSPMEAGHLAGIAKKFEGCCIYGRRVYDSVEEAALAADGDRSSGVSDRRKGRTRRSHD